MILYHIPRLIKKYDEKIILNISSLKIDEQKIYALLGPNGAGKTTLLNILGFLEPPDSGNIFFRSRPVHYSEPSLQALRKEVVMVDQHPILFTTTVYKNLEFGLKVRRVPPSERRHIIEETLDLVGMGRFIQAPAHKLSGGETQRVALARALAVSPRVLLCDEPTSSVDVENQAIIIEILRKINAQKKITILFTTHDSSQVASLAHHTLVLSRGTITAAEPG